jgi:hypothetical protein
VTVNKYRKKFRKKCLQIARISYNEDKRTSRGGEKVLLKEKIGQRLKLAREAAGYTQDEVQALLGYRSRGTYHITNKANA